MYDIIDSTKTAEQRTVAGLDEFVVEGIEAWRSLSSNGEELGPLVVKSNLLLLLDIVETMPIRQADRKRLIKQIDMAEQYQKINHIGHCSDDADCITHCTTFGLSDPKCAEHHSNCSHVHTSHCPDCINIIVTPDEINQKIQKIVDRDIEREAKCDFENASEHIIEWSRHNLRTARQDAEKKSTISQTDKDEDFCTFDWGQKILPQKHREVQTTYFGKKGMSVLVDSFVWKDQVPRLNSTSTTTTSISPPTYSTESYIVAITDAAQTELDTLSDGEIITKQFKTDHPHIISTGRKFLISCRVDKNYTIRKSVKNEYMVKFLQIRIPKFPAKMFFEKDSPVRNTYNSFFFSLSSFFIAHAYMCMYT